MIVPLKTFASGVSLLVEVLLYFNFCSNHHLLSAWIHPFFLLRGVLCFLPLLGLSFVSVC